MRAEYARTFRDPKTLHAICEEYRAATTLDYYSSAWPIAMGDTGNRAFASNQGNVIWQDAAGNPPVEPFAIGVGVAPIQ